MRRAAAALRKGTYPRLEFIIYLYGGCHDSLPYQEVIPVDKVALSST